LNAAGACCGGRGDATRRGLHRVAQRVAATLFTRSLFCRRALTGKSNRCAAMRAAPAVFDR